MVENIFCYMIKRTALMSLFDDGAHYDISRNSLPDLGEIRYLWMKLKRSVSVTGHLRSLIISTDS